MCSPIPIGSASSHCALATSGHCSECRCFATAYILNDESSELVDAGRGKFKLEPGDGRYRVVNPHVPEACVAFEEDYFLSTARRGGLELKSMHYGLWSGRETWFDFQDIAILRKRS